jgi:hypothetical protein
VYHYTDVNGLLGIVQSNTLWASSLLGLNDTSEADCGVRLIQDEADNLGPGLMKDYLTELLRGQAPAQVVKGSVYVVSPATEQNLLTLWRGYSGGVGFALGVDANRPLAVILDGGRTEQEGTGSSGFSLAGYWHVVRYREDDQRELIRGVLALHESIFARTEDPTAGEFPSPLILARWRRS